MERVAVGLEVKKDESVAFGEVPTVAVAGKVPIDVRVEVTDTVAEAVETVDLEPKKGDGVAKKVIFEVVELVICEETDEEGVRVDVIDTVVVAVDE